MAADPNVHLVAMGDTFADRIDSAHNMLQHRSTAVRACKFPPSGGSPASTLTSTSSRRATSCCCATPPHFRPAHLKAAIAAGKHVFAEKPVAVDAGGVRSVIESVSWLKRNGSPSSPGLCYRYDPRMRATLDQDPRRRRRRHCRHGDQLQHARPVEPSAAALLERYGMADSQLALLHLAFGRFQRRAARPQPRQNGLGDAGPVSHRVQRHGRTPDPHRARIRQHLRSHGRGLRISTTASKRSAAAGSRTAARST